MKKNDQTHFVKQDELVILSKPALWA